MENIVEKNIKIKSSSDKLPLSVTIFIPKKPIGIFQISHGMTEHKERYYNFMKYLTSLGYITIINDHRGHGKSIKSNDDLGYFYEKKGEYIVEDVHQISLYIKKEYPKLPLYLFGHSMGSLVALKYLQKYDKDIDKLILCGLPSYNILVGFALLTTKIITLFKGDHYRSKLLNNLVFGSYSKKVGDKNNKFSWLCTNEKVFKEYEKDDLSGFIFTTNGFQNLFHLMSDSFKRGKYYVSKNNLPILLIAGSEDPVINSIEDWQFSRQTLCQVGYTDTEKILYEGLRHELLNEKGKEKIYNDILSFIKKDLP